MPSLFHLTKTVSGEVEFVLVGAGLARTFSTFPSGASQLSTSLLAGPSQALGTIRH